MPFQRSYEPATLENEGLSSSTSHMEYKIRPETVNPPWPYRIRVVILLLSIGITATALAMGLVAVNKSIQQKSMIATHFVVVYSVRVTVHNGNIYVPNMVTTIGSIGLLASAIYALGASCYNHRTSRLITMEKLKSTFVTPIYLIVVFTIWMIISLIFESIWFHNGKITVTRNDGVRIPPWDVINALVELGVTDRFKNVRYWRFALAFQWAAAATGFMTSVLLLCAGIGIQTFTALTPQDVEETGRYHYKKRTSATNLDGPVAQRMSALDVAPPETEDEIVIQPRTSTDGPQYISYPWDRDTALDGPHLSHTVLTSRSPFFEAYTRGPQFSGLHADSEGDIGEILFDKVAPGPVQLNSLDEGAHTFIQNDETPSRDNGELSNLNRQA